MHASWLLPIAQPPVRNGWVEIEAGRIVAVGSGAPRHGDIDLRDTAILPGLVNAHTHLELSYLGGAVPAAAEFVQWIRQVVRSRREHPDPKSSVIMSSVAQGIAQSIAAGTAVVGDISNTLVTYAPLAASDLAAVVFNELIRFNTPEPAAMVAEACRDIGDLPPSPTVRASLAAHAPYSVAPQVFTSIATAPAVRDRPISVHLSESPEEVEFIAHGTGGWRGFLGDVGAWNPEWRAPGTTPVAYLDALGFLTPRTIVVHGVQMSRLDLELLRQRGATLVACPRSNAHTGAGTPPIAEFYASGVRVAVGTDSLASTDDLSVFAEMAAMRRLAPEVPARRLLESATSQGAAALGFGDTYGSIEPGKRARLLAVAIPSGVADVEEYLVGGVKPAAIRWVSPPDL